MKIKKETKAWENSMENFGRYQNGVEFDFKCLRMNHPGSVMSDELSFDKDPIFLNILPEKHSNSQYIDDKYSKAFSRSKTMKNYPKLG
jgi:hypothetical protein